MSGMAALRAIGSAAPNGGIIIPLARPSTVMGYSPMAFLIRIAASCGSTPSVYQSKTVR